MGDWVVSRACPGAEDPAERGPTIISVHPSRERALDMFEGAARRGGDAGAAAEARRALAGPEKRAARPPAVYVLARARG